MTTKLTRDIQEVKHSPALKYMYHFKYLDIRLVYYKTEKNIIISNNLI